MSMSIHSIFNHWSYTRHFLLDIIREILVCFSQRAKEFHATYRGKKEPEVHVLTNGLQVHGIQSHSQSYELWRVPMKDPMSMSWEV